MVPAVPCYLSVLDKNLKLGYSCFAVIKKSETHVKETTGDDQN